MLREEDKLAVKKKLEGLPNPVRLVYFTQQIAGACQYCLEGEMLLKELTPLSSSLSLEIVNFVTDQDKVAQYGIDKIPATAIIGKEDYGIRFYGIPAGYEFASFLDTIVRVGQGQSGIPGIQAFQVKAIAKPVHIQVFVTPTCPYCTKAASTAYQFAMENPLIRTDVIEVTEFPYLGQKYNVMGVPKVVINEKHSFEGALPEEQFLERIQKAVA
jgi:glutaredoxin-like protein